MALATCSGSPARRWRDGCKEDTPVKTMIHESDHCIEGNSHPNQGGGGTGVDGGVAPLVGIDRTRCLMASGGHRADDGYLLVKKEWDAAETWMNNNVIP